MRPLRVTGPVEPRAIFDPERSCNTIRSFTVTLTGNVHQPPYLGGTWQVIWQPTKGTTFRLKGWRCQAYVYVTLAGSASAYGNLAFFDVAAAGPYSSPGDIVCHVSGPVNLTSAAGTEFSMCGAQELPGGRISRAANTPLSVGMIGSGIGAGQIAVVGEVWGVEE